MHAETLLRNHGNSLGRRQAFSLSSQVQGRGHAHCVRMDNMRMEKSLIEQCLRARVIYLCTET